MIKRQKLSTCFVCKDFIGKAEPTGYASPSPSEPLFLGHKRCVPHNHHSKCDCGLTRDQAQRLGCDFKEPTKRLQ